ncbi:MAG: thermonuclease family protein [Bacteroidetes bacterium]|nr:thermonuclease family protein [Bacteroidota bacterium]
MGKEVTVKYHKLDRSKRILGMFIMQKQSINLEMVAKGLPGILRNTPPTNDLHGQNKEPDNSKRGSGYSHTLLHPGIIGRKNKKTSAIPKTILESLLTKYQ